jgi:hypothetical protein
MQPCGRSGSRPPTAATHAQPPQVGDAPRHPKLGRGMYGLGRPGTKRQACECATPAAPAGSWVAAQGRGARAQAGMLCVGRWAGHHVARRSARSTAGSPCWCWGSPPECKTCTNTKPCALLGLGRGVRAKTGRGSDATRQGRGCRRAQGLRCPRCVPPFSHPLEGLPAGWPAGGPAAHTLPGAGDHQAQTRARAAPGAARPPAGSGW